MTNPHILRVGRWSVRLQWEPQDLLIGVYWMRSSVALHVYICLVPCVPLHLWRMDDKPPFPGERIIA